MADAQQALLDRLAARVAIRTGLDLDAAREAVDEALVHRGEHLSVVRAEVAAMVKEAEAPFKAAYRSISTALRRACAAPPPSAAATGPTTPLSREGVRDRSRGLRMVAHHPDLADLDRLLDALYEHPDT